MPALLARVPQHPEKAEKERGYRQRIPDQMAHRRILYGEGPAIDSRYANAEYAHACALAFAARQHNKVQYEKQDGQRHYDHQVAVRAYDGTAADGRDDERERHNGDQGYQEVEHPRAVAQPEPRLLKRAYERVSRRRVPSVARRLTVGRRAVSRPPGAGRIRGSSRDRALRRKARASRQASPPGQPDAAASSARACRPPALRRRLRLIAGAGMKLCRIASRI